MEWIIVGYSTMTAVDT